ncbi:aminotransferase class III-fold pyridoxal phosphate-dependent enzyme [Chitinophaga silvatica]|uniref:Aminotransferase class III-fold pyridoxal phosphate-dependent enzyme n=1 Tax=Chitinophaga silvatica TaxID=2282649 RepID=A0A3E1Y3B4_9BACT|nr:aminotransferase class III-fold pyridoxal phosphate-dependent enzyme [Chitinophaga silvatica]RFS19161.1 aminotransferase class III-fold pyridoxal phosphate-dependent enzyme [Chitinophaga silvatica]
MEFTANEVKQLVQKNYLLAVEVDPLQGYDEFNYKITDTSGRKFILKITGEEKQYSFLDAQLRILDHLTVTDVAWKFQQILRNKNRQELTPVFKDGKQYYVRILTWLEGECWAKVQVKTKELYLDLGRFMGKTDEAMREFQHDALHRHYTWDISTAADSNRLLQHIHDHEKRRLAGYFLLAFDTEVVPVLQELRHACIHGDANDYNVLVQDGKISGLIDLGDMVYTALVNNVAIACTYAMFRAEDPLQAAAWVIQGYHEAFPLTEQEVDLIYYLIAARMCISVTQSAFQASQGSSNSHHFVTEEDAWDLLNTLIRINPLRAADTFRKACGMPSLINREEEYSVLLEERKSVIGRNLSISYRKPLKIVKGALQYLYDDKGDTYIDCVNNPSHVGHCHPVVVKAMQRQIATLNTNSRYLNDHLVEYAKELLSTLPSNLAVVYFTNSGSEANDLAIRMSRHFTGRKDVMVLDHAYHGTSTVAMEMSPYKFDGKGGFGQKPYIHKAVSPDLYRGEFRYDDPLAGEKYAEDVLQILEKNPGKIAAFICETLLGVGGQIPLPDHYLENVYKHIRAAGGVCIADEVQVGFGRVGEKFWGFELQNVQPDIVVLGKPIGNGHPLAAVVVTREIADAFNNGMEYFNTFGGNPVSMVTGRTVLNVIKSEQMQQHALETGNFLMDGLREVMSKHPVISDVRGFGLFVGAEMVKDRTSMEPAVEEINAVVEKMKERGFLLSTDGPLYNVLKIKPPMVFNKQNATDMVRHLDEVLTELNF